MAGASRRNDTGRKLDAIDLSGQRYVNAYDRPISVHPRIRGVDEPESQNFNKIEDFFRRGPSSSTGVQLFCTVPNFLQAVPTDYIEII